MGKKMVSSLPLLPCELSLFVKENPDKNKQTKPNILILKNLVYCEMLFFPHKCTSRRFFILPEVFILTENLNTTSTCCKLKQKPVALNFFPQDFRYFFQVIKQQSWQVWSFSQSSKITINYCVAANIKVLNFRL